MADASQYCDSTRELNPENSETWPVLIESAHDDRGYVEGLDTAGRKLAEYLTTLDMMGVPYQAVLTILSGSPDFGQLERSLLALEQAAWGMKEDRK